MRLNTLWTRLHPHATRLRACDKPAWFHSICSVMTTQQGIDRVQNGTLTHDNRHNKLSVVCEEINARVTAFLSSDPGTDRLHRVQEQSRASLRVIREASTLR